MVTDAYRNAIMKLWDGRCDAFTVTAVKDKDTGRTAQNETVLFRNEPCRVSYSSIASASPQSEAADVRQVIKLFISKDVKIPEGAKLVITQEGRTEKYRRAGKPAVYSVHQEVILELEKEWA